MSGFQFKQFYLAQNNCAMKVGTDGVLLGSWADIGDSENILDVGTGTVSYTHLTLPTIYSV